MEDSERMFNKLNRGQQFKARKAVKERLKDSNSGGFAMVSRRLYEGGHIAKMGAASQTYVFIVMNTNDKDMVCWMSKEQISEASKLSLRTVERHIATLKELGYIDWAQYKEGGRDHNVYFTIPLDEIEGKAVEVEATETMTVTVNVIEEEQPVKVERKPQLPKEKVTAEELAQAEAEFDFMGERKAPMIQVIKEVGYRPGYSKEIEDTWDKGDFSYNISNYKAYWITGVWGM